ncbi:MAG: long-chain-fatty-acid--CoA ligase [Rhizobiales bacterium]|nr:long-chain-fatty-acid--CoA ligase [Hyphomicrobiales bacterium]
MLGLMQNWPLLIHKIIDHAASQHPDREVVSRSVEGPIHRIGYRDVRRRALRCASRLVKDGIKPGDRVATLAWNTWRHLESWYGITGMGAVYHTINPRLFPDQIAWIANHAGDRILMTDLTFVPLLEALADKLPTIERYVIFTDDAHMPPTKLKNAVSYESWIAEGDEDFRWAEVDENAAAGLCYTSGTTGNPKGVLYSHRSNVLHSMAMCSPDCLGLGARTTILPVVPLFHANSWSIAFSAPMSGAKLVMPGARLDGASVYELLESEQVTVTAGVPTVWMMLLQHMEKEGRRFSSLKRAVVGGSAAPRAMIETFESVYGVEIFHAWGMTEMSPVGSIGSIKPALGDLKGAALFDVKQKQGFAPFTVEMRIDDDEGNPKPWDGKTFGRLKVKGPAVAAGYFKGEGGNILDANGFFDTGDIATIDEHGFMQITDRAKDVIKSGGEWISSIDLENLAVAHPDVAEAAVIGVFHPKWDERPLLIVVPKEGRECTAKDILTFMEGRIAKWWLPDDVQVVKEIPHTATGKINKLKLREAFKIYRLPNT